jgi:hypothetical protein
MQKLQKLQELTGNQQLAFSQADLDGDFDPGQHDALMQVGGEGHCTRSGHRMQWHPGFHCVLAQ